MLYKRGKYYWVKRKFMGRTIRQSTRQTTRRKALVYEASLKEELDNARLGDSGKTFEDAAVRWLAETTHKTSWSGDQQIIRWLDPHIGRLFLSEITRQKIEELRQLKFQEASKSTVDHYMACLRSILRKACHEWEWIDDVPKIPMYPKKKSVPRWITLAEFEQLAKELPEHLEAVARFAVTTGLRAGPIKALQWSWVHGDYLLLPPHIMKNDLPMKLPLSAKAIKVLSQSHQHPSTVFTYQGNPISGKLSTRAWRKAVKRAKLEPLRFHDLRHTWASWHVQNGTPIEVLKELGGWKSLSMVLVYAHLAPSTLTQWVDNAQEGSQHPDARKRLKGAQRGSQQA